jgi:RND family efflux transporter MFP subunit
VQVPQAFSASLKPGVSATFDLPQYPGQQFHAQLKHISQSFTSSSHTMQVELQADNANGELFGGSYATVHFEIPVPPSLVQVPATALMVTNKGTNVATVDAGGKVSIKKVKLGRDFGDSVEILSGLTPSDQVIDSPPETIVDGEQVQIAQKQNQATDSHSADASQSGRRVN